MDITQLIEGYLVEAKNEENRLKDAEEALSWIEDQSSEDGKIPIITNTTSDVIRISPELVIEYYQRKASEAHQKFTGWLLQIREVINKNCPVENDETEG